MVRFRSGPVARIVGAGIGLLALWLVVATGARAAGTVTLEGYVWGASLEGGTQITVHRGEGATVRIDEYPNLTATAAADGYWTLEVPDRANITPCTEYEGHHPMCDQTFFTRGRDLNQVNFQMVENLIGSVLAAASGAETITLPSGVKRVKQCAIVSTFFEKEKRSYLDFQDFLDDMPHGIAGARAEAAPTAGGTPLAGPIYYNESVIPQTDLIESSRDGGVMWVNIPPGTYTVTATHSTARFSQFQATCRDGRLINANPPWGLYEMARTEEPNPAVLPGPGPGSRLEARVTAAKVVRSGHRRQVRVRIRTTEPVTARVSVMQGRQHTSVKSELRRSGLVRLPLNASFRAGSLRAVVTITDRNRNRSRTNLRLYAPKSRP